MWIIDKAFEFDYGHRVWTQSLNEEYSLDNMCVCRHLHGHRGKVMVHLKGMKLNQAQMVTDFKHLNWLKKWIDVVLDHKMILDKNDPLVKSGRIAGELTVDEYLEEHVLIEASSYYTVKPEVMSRQLDAGSIDEHDVEFLEGIVLVNFSPTSENLARWFFNVVKGKMQSLLNAEDIALDSIEFFETPKSRTLYYG